jgi:hypothetical protein
MNLYRRLFIAILAFVGLSSSESLAQITLVKTITPNSNKTTGTSIALTIPAGGIAAGNSIILSFAMDPATGTVSKSQRCSD